MANGMHHLVEGERDYLRVFSSFLNEVRARAEAATQIRWGDDVTLRTHSQALVQPMRGKRPIVLRQLAEIRVAADRANRDAPLA